MTDAPKVLLLDFQVAATATIRVVASSAAEARSAIERTFDRSSMEDLEDRASGLELVDLHLIGPATLATIDGEDPVAELEAALEAHRRGGDPAS